MDKPHLIQKRRNPQHRIRLWAWKNLGNRGRNIQPQKTLKPPLHPSDLISDIHTSRNRNDDIYECELLAISKPYKLEKHRVWTTPNPVNNTLKETWTQMPNILEKSLPQSKRETDVSPRWFAELQTTGFFWNQTCPRLNTSLPRPISLKTLVEVTTCAINRHTEDVVVLPSRTLVNTAIQVLNIDSISEKKMDETIVKHPAPIPTTHEKLAQNNQHDHSPHLRPPLGELPGWRKEGR